MNIGPAAPRRPTVRIATALVTVKSNGDQLGDTDAALPSLSQNGKWVAFALTTPYVGDDHNKDRQLRARPASLGSPGCRSTSGAGFGGLELATMLSEALGDEVEVTLIDKGDAFVFGFSKLDVMFGRATPEAVRLPVPRLRQAGRALRCGRRSRRSIPRRGA